MLNKRAQLLLCSLVFILGIGKTCNIGWSGFDQFAQFFRGDSIKTIEVCLQPVIADTEEYGFFCLQLSDPQKKLEIDPIYVDISILQDATETIKIHTVQEPITLTILFIYTLIQSLLIMTSFYLMIFAQI